MPEISDEKLGLELEAALDRRARSVEVGDAAERVALARSRAERRRTMRPMTAIGVAAAVIVALVGGFGFAVWRSGGGLPGEAAASTSPTTSASAPAAVASASAVPSMPSPATPTPALSTPAGTPFPTQSLSPRFGPAGSTDNGAPVSTLLADGRVLFVESWNLVSVLGGGAELYDPAAGGFVPTESIPSGRIRESVTGLKDGRALVVGGLGVDGGQVGDTELYDPRTGKFTATGSLSTPRLNHTATLLSDGRVLVIGGVTITTNDELASAEIYDPKTGKFTPTGSMSAPRCYHTATLLPDGRVLVVGGVTAFSANGDSETASAEIYDPKTGEFAPTGSMNLGRYSHTATLLKDGRVLVAGGMSGGMSGPMASDGTGGTISSTAEIYDPKSGTFGPTGSMNVDREEHTATLLPNGQVLVTGGISGPNGARNAIASIELYDPSTGKFTLAGAMATPRMGHTATLLPSGLVLIAGGVLYTGSDYIQPEASQLGDWVAASAAELYKP